MFKQTKEQKAIVKSVKEFAKGEFDKDAILALDKEGEFPYEICKKAGQLGFLGIDLSEDDAGGGMEMAELMLISQTFAQYDATLGAAIMLSVVGAEWIAQFAPNPVKEKILPDLLEGNILSGCAFPGAAGNLSLTKTEDGKNWIINGEADHVINGGRADLYFLPLNGQDPGFIVIDAVADGITIEKQYQPLGLRMTGFAKLKLTGVRIPQKNCIVTSKKSQHFLLAPLRMLVAFLALGTARGAMDRAVSHIKARVQFGRKIADFQVLRHKVAAMETTLNQAESLITLAAQTYSPINPDTALIAMACTASMSAATGITHEAIQLMGGYGYTVEYEVERFCRDAKTLQMMSQGTLSLYDDIADAVIGKVG